MAEWKPFNSLQITRLRETSALNNSGSVHTTLKEFNNEAITGHFGFVFEENVVSEIAWLWWRYRFRNPFSKC